MYLQFAKIACISILVRLYKNIYTYIYTYMGVSENGGIPKM